MENSDYTIRIEQPADFRATENLTREAFWNVYQPGCSEHYVLHCLRSDKDFVPELSFVMEKDGEIIGNIIFVKAVINTDDGKDLQVLTFGPISIAPKFKHMGYGTKLLSYAMDKAKEYGAGALCIEGDIGFYGKLGFVVGFDKGIDYHAEPRGSVVPYFLIKELIPNYLSGITGVYHTPKGYFVEDDDVEQFDAQFPKKIKQKLTGQLI